MELVTGFSNPSRISVLNVEALASTEYVEAAIAYVFDTDTLIKGCFDRDVPLTIWARYDYTQPVAVPVLEKFLFKRSPNFVFYFVPDVFHPKVIWWHGYGAYIGSANLTLSAWSGNIEAGLFLTEDELANHGISGELSNFFDEIRRYEHPLTQELLKEVNRFTFDEQLQREMVLGEKRFDAHRILPKTKSLISVDRKPSLERNREEFLKEWNSTLETLRMIASRVVDYRPRWVEPKAPTGTQADLFLHAYYYERVRDGNRHPFREFYEQNHRDPEKALVTAMEWWASLSAAPGMEAEMLYSRLPLLQNKLREHKVLLLSTDEFEQVVISVHAMSDHAMRVKWSSFGLAESLPKMNWTERAHYFASWLYQQLAPDGSNVLAIMNYVLYGGLIEKAPERIFEVCHNHFRKIPHLGVNSLGEILGWVHPTYYPPRNGRTSKALVALGFKVGVFAD
jgi:hypothetical protein